MNWRVVMSDLRDIMNRISAALKDDTGVNKNQLDRIFTDLHTELTKSDWAIEDEALREEYEKMFVHWTAKRYLELTQAVDVSVDLSGSAKTSSSVRKPKKDTTRESE